MFVYQYEFISILLHKINSFNLNASKDFKSEFFGVIEKPKITYEKWWTKTADKINLHDYTSGNSAFPVP